jgi:hypothetical protein
VTGDAHLGDEAAQVVDVLGRDGDRSDRRLRFRRPLLLFADASQSSAQVADLASGASLSKVRRCRLRLGACLFEFCLFLFERFLRLPEGFVLFALDRRDLLTLGCRRLHRLFGRGGLGDEFGSAFPGFD